MRSRRPPSGRDECGLSLLELLMVLAIISIISLFSIPWYQEYIVKTQIANQLYLLKDIKNRVEEYAAHYGAFPVTNAELGLKPATAYAREGLKQIYLDTSPVEGALHFELDIPKLGSDNLLIYSPSMSGHNIEWSCTYSTIRESYLPALCNN